MSKGNISVLVVLLILLIDQASKIYIKTHMQLGEEVDVVGDWFKIHFTENKGMAFGMEFGGDFGKIVLTLFRLIVATGIGWYIYTLAKKNAPTGLIISVSFILAGALGNILDSAIYGLIFSDSYYQVASFLPAEGGYAPFLQGKVVDMLYFPLIQGNYPEWFMDGDHFIFFRPVFNIADSVISIGVGIIIIFQRTYFNEEENKEEVVEEA